MFWQDFFSNFLATVLGVLIGIPAGIWLNKIIQKSKHEDEKKNKINILIKDLEKNISLLRQMQKEIPQNTLFYNLDLNVWRSHGAQILSVINNEKLFLSVTKFYYEIEHIYKKIDSLYNMYSSPVRALDGYKSIVKTLRKSLIVHLTKVIPLGENLLMETKSFVVKG